MTGTQILLIVLGVIAFAAIAIAFIFPYLKRKGIDVDKVLGQTKDALGTINKTLEIIRPFIDDKSSISIVDKICSIASIGVGNAEQLYHIGQLEAGDRKDEAYKYITDSLKLIGVDITPEVDRVIEGAIQAEVLGLGHKSDTIKNDV